VQPELEVVAAGAELVVLVLVRIVEVEKVVEVETWAVVRAVLLVVVLNIVPPLGGAPAQLAITRIRLL